MSKIVNFMKLCQNFDEILFPAPTWGPPDNSCKNLCSFVLASFYDLSYHKQGVKSYVIAISKADLGDR
jgi:hypothetical protein